MKPVGPSLLLCLSLIGSLLPLAFVPLRAAAQTGPTPPNLRYAIGGSTGPVSNIVVSKDGTLFASASQEGTIKVWRMSDGMLQRTYVPIDAIPNCVAFSPDGTAAAAGDTNGNITIWSVANDTILRTFNAVQAAAQGSAGGVTSIAYSADGTLLAASGIVNPTGTNPYSAINLYKTSNGNFQRALTGHTKTISQIAFSPIVGSNVLASASLDSTIRIWNTTSGTTTRTINAFNNTGPGCLAFSYDGKQVAAGGVDQVSGANPTADAKVWNLATGSQAAMINAYAYPYLGVSAVAFSPDGTLLATGGTDSGSVWNPKTFNIASGALVNTFSPVPTYNQSGITTLAFSNDGGLLLSGGYQDIRQDNVASGTVARSVTPLNGDVTDIAFPPDGSQLTVLSGSMIDVFSISDGSGIAQFSGGSPLAYSPDGALFGFGSNVQILDAGYNFTIQTLKSNQTPQFIRFSADDQTVYTIGQQLLPGDLSAVTCEIWRLPDGALLNTVQMGATPNVGLAVSQDGTRLAGVSTTTGQPSVWSLPDGALVQTMSLMNVSIAALSSDGSYVAFATNSAPDAYLYRVSDGTLLLDQSAPSSASVQLLALSPFGDSLACCRTNNHSGSITVTGVSGQLSGQLLAYWNDQLGTGIDTMAYSPDASSLVLGRRDGVALVCYNPATPALSSLKLSQYMAAGPNETPQGTVTINQSAPANGSLIALTSSDPAAASVPTHVMVPAGKTIATFPVTTFAVAAPTSVTITASGNGISRSVTLTVTPTIAPKSLAFVPANVEGGGDAVGVVTLKSPAYAGGAVVSLVSANPAIVSVPTSVTVPAGKSSARFAIQTGTVLAATVVNVTATAGGTPLTAKLTVSPATLASLNLVPNSVQGGVENSIGIVTLTAPSEIDITVAISVTTAATVGDVSYPTTVTVPAGAYNATFDISTNKPKTSKDVVTFKAQIGVTGAAGTTSKTANLTLTP